MCGLNCLIDFPNWKLQNHPLKMQMKIFLDQILFCQLGRYQVSIHDAPCSSIFEECCLGLSEPLWLKLPSCQTVELKIDKNSFQSIINIHQLVHLIWFSGAAFQSISTKFIGPFNLRHGHGRFSDNSELIWIVNFILNNFWTRNEFAPPTRRHVWLIGLICECLMLEIT